MLQTVPLEINLEPFPGYRLLGCLGRGGFGEVWEAETPTHRRAALKFLPCDAERTTAQELKALQAVRHLRHPHLIRLDQVWCHLGYIVIAMELADGSLFDLYQACQEEYGAPLDAKQVCYFLSQAATALDYLNARQHQVDGRVVAVQHCDIKPSNLLLFDDRVKVADFGLSSWLAARRETRRPAGTLEYSAPEVFQGRLAEQSDQYSLAVTYCLLRGGKLPYHDTPDSFQPLAVRPPPELSGLTEAEQPIVARALSTAAPHRWPSCGEFMTRLSKVVD